MRAGHLGRDRLGGLICLAMSGAYGAAATRIPTLPVDAFEVMNARTMPFALCAVGVLLALILLVRAPANLAPVAPAAHRVAMVAALLALTCGYGLVMPLLGFVVSTTVFLVIAQLLLGERRIWVVACGSLPVVAAMWLVLSQGLGVFLAPGSLFEGG